ncbi:hypothetical protein ADK90_28200 [Streptomyces sp. XY413]|uniref:RNA polymerase sigma factor n=1 Tax=unclassified Streptomyces TaxID=2593676 RepID=UPI0006AE3847|nr:MULTISPECIES: sigma-70 family RNA polymerase sigma factor [unclassified Streptomyces]KOU59204.1 hypothetical protein ADK96_33165 [Streptomyces sp. IGB124]KOV16391.1 hypothetical protein ADK90_28200 [Streptomyces sp. XY413]
MNVNMPLDCLGCADESDRLAVVFPTDADGRPLEAPTGLYGEKDRWCSPCWVYQDPFEQFELLYGRRLRKYTRGRLYHLPGGAREMAVDDVSSEVMEVLWRRREDIVLPERAMYKTVVWITRRRFPMAPAEAPTDAVRVEEDAEEDGAEDPMDEVLNRILLDEELKKLPPLTRQYLYEHKGMGESAEEVARRHGVKKSTVTESTRRGLTAMRPRFAELPFYAALVETIRQIIEWLLMLLTD